MIADEQVQAIQSRDYFVRFVRSLASTLDQAPEGWENGDLKSFLEAMAAWTEDMDGYYRDNGEPVPETPNWKILGEILSAAKVYE